MTMRGVLRVPCAGTSYAVVACGACGEPAPPVCCVPCTRPLHRGWMGGGTSRAAASPQPTGNASTLSWGRGKASHAHPRTVAVGSAFGKHADNGNGDLFDAIAVGGEGACLAALEDGGAVDLETTKGSGFGVGLTPLMYAALNGWEAVCLSLLERGASADPPPSEEGYTLLMLAAIGGLEALCVELLRLGCAKEVTDDVEWTALMHAASEGNAAICQYLIDAGADPDAEGHAQETSLSLACGGKVTKRDDGYLHTASVLVAGGAKVDATDRNGLTPLMHAAIQGRSEVIVLLMRNGAKIDQRVAARAPAQYANYTALLVAIAQGQTRVACALVEMGADSNATGADGMTPLLAAAKGGYNDVGGMLLDRGAGVRVNARDAKGRTALMHAAASGGMEFCMALLAHDADVNQQDVFGHTPLMFAIHNLVHHNESAPLVMELVRAGADVTACNNEGVRALDVQRLRRSFRLMLLELAQPAGKQP